MIKFLFLPLVLFSTNAFSATYSEKLSFIFSKYAERFESGKYVSRPEQINSFNQLQDAFKNEMRHLGALKLILTVKNDFESDLVVVTLYSLTNEDGTLLAIYREKSKYYDEEERSFLRFSSLNSLSDGINFIRLNTGYALNVKGYYFKPDVGGTLRINYLTNLNNNSFSSLDLFLVRSKGNWGFTDSEKNRISSLFVRTWKSFFPPNGGVKELVLN